MSDYKMGWTEALRILKRDVDAHPAWGAGDIYDRLSALQGELDRPKAPTGHPHGTVNLHRPDGSTWVQLHVDEARIRTMGDANNLRGLRVDEIVIYPDDTMPETLKGYLHEDVLAPMRADIEERKKGALKQQAERTLAIYTDYGRRIAELENWRKQCATAVIPWPADVLARIAALEQQSKLHQQATNELHARVSRWEHGDGAQAIEELRARLGDHKDSIDGLALELQQLANRPCTPENIAGAVERHEEQIGAHEARIRALEPSLATNPGAQKIERATEDEAYERWRSTPWGDEQIEKFIRDAEPKTHKNMCLIMDSAFRAGFKAAR